MAVTAPAAEAHDEVLRVIATAVDAGFYRAAYRDVAGVDPIRHYLQAGWREGRDPAPWFSSSAYLADNADIAASGVEPLFHYLTHGRREGRDVSPSAHAADYLYPDDARSRAPRWTFTPPGADEPLGPIEGELPGLTRADRELAGAEFDPAYYLLAYPDVAQADIDPLDHFLLTGWHEGRNPNPRFSVSDYLATYADVADAGINPFLHYLRSGRAEGRLPSNDLGFRYRILERLTPVEARVAAARAGQEALALGSAANLAAAMRTRRRALHLTFSHDDYTTHLGGVQLCLRREAARIAEQGRDHLHVFPARPWPVIRAGREFGPLGVLWNGEFAGVFEAPAIVDSLAQKAAGRQASYAVHSLLGHDPDETAEILRAAGAGQGDFWLHDFASLCAGFHLMRNDVDDCAAPAPDSAACTLCVYGDWRARHMAGHARFFELMSPRVVSPSQPTLDLWRARWPGPAPADAVVHPHVRLVERAAAPAADPDRPFRLAFAGFPTPHKGWPVFRKLVLRHADDPRYDFLHLGRHTQGDLAVEFHETSVSEARPQAMREAIERVEADAVLIWPLCRETFSLSAYESAAAGAAVITGPDSGNVAAFVRTGGHGVVLDDEAALAAAFESGEILTLARARRSPRLYDSGIL